MSGQCAKASVRRTWSAANGPKGASGSSPSTLSSRSSRFPAGPSTTGPSCSERTSRNAIPGCERSASSSPGRRSSICSSVTRPGSRGNEISPRLPEAITETSGIASVLRLLEPLAGRGADGVAHRGVARGDLGHARVEGGQALVGVRVLGADLAAAVALDDVLEAFAVALAEGRALALAVVGEHDQLVRPRPVLGGRGDPLDREVDAPQHRERVRPLQPGVVRDLVVGQERRVDHRPARRARRRSPPRPAGRAGSRSRRRARARTPSRA